jgi:glutathione S-transferase
LSLIGWSVLVPMIAARLADGELQEALKKVPLEEQRQKWLTAAAESFTEEELAEARRKVTVSMERMEGLLTKRKWLAGNEYSLADVNSYSMVMAVPRHVPEAMSEEKTPRSMAWLDKMNARPAVRAALATSRQKN